MTTMKEALDEIRAAISRGKGTFALTPGLVGQGKPFSLVVGSIRAVCATQEGIRAVQIPGGFIITLGLARDQVKALRAMCDDLLGAEDAIPS